MSLCFQFSFESLYRSLNYTLLDNACREYLFVVDFFAVSGDDALALFNAIFGRTLQILQVDYTTVLCLAIPQSDVCYSRNIWRLM